MIWEHIGILAFLSIAAVMIAAQLWIFIQKRRQRCEWCRQRTDHPLEPLNSPDTGNTAAVCLPCFAGHINLLLAQGQNLGDQINAGIISREQAFKIVQAMKEAKKEKQC